MDSIHGDISYRLFHDVVPRLGTNSCSSPSQITGSINMSSDRSSETLKGSPIDITTISDSDDDIGV